MIRTPLSSLRQITPLIAKPCPLILMKSLQSQASWMVIITTVVEQQWSKLGIETARKLIRHSNQDSSPSLSVLCILPVHKTLQNSQVCASNRVQNGVKYTCTLIQTTWQKDLRAPAALFKIETIGNVAERKGESGNDV